MVTCHIAFQKGWLCQSSPCFSLNDGKEETFYGHYAIFPIIFFHLFGALPGITLGHNSGLQENSDDEPHFCKDPLTLICHMWSLCVRLKMTVLQVWVPEQAHHRTPPNHRRDAAQAEAGVWRGSRDNNHLLFQFIVPGLVTKIILYFLGFCGLDLSHLWAEENAP